MGIRPGSSQAASWEEVFVIYNNCKTVVPVKCLLKVSDIEANLDSLSTLLGHTGTTGRKSLQSEVLKGKFIFMCVKAEIKCGNLFMHVGRPQESSVSLCERWASLTC